MLVFVGQAAFSPFRMAERLARIQAMTPAITHIEATHYVIANADSLDARELQQLASLLANPPMVVTQHANCTAHFWSMPRAGTVSPWSTKSLEVLHDCGLHQVHRIEQGIGYRLTFASDSQLTVEECLKNPALQKLWYDPLTESLLSSWEELKALFHPAEMAGAKTIPILSEGREVLAAFNQTAGLALNDAELDYLMDLFKSLNRNPTDVELMMFAQANSEHCRHKIFKSKWTIDGEEKPKSLFGWIRNTYQNNPNGVLTAYDDNGAVLEGTPQAWWQADAKSHAYEWQVEPMHAVIKVETHNHPTAVSPFPGAATGSGGEIRDEAATGRGARSKAGLTGFTVSNLCLPDVPQPWEENSAGKAPHLSSALNIMIEAPIGAAAFNNEFGRPNITGYFRTFEQADLTEPNEWRGYHKPIMIAGGLGNIRNQEVKKLPLTEGTLIIVLGGPGLPIGLGGGAASSRIQTEQDTALDFASVQRGNPEMQRRCQEVINQCYALGDLNPILSIHDVGAGGLSNAVPELLSGGNQGGRVQLRAIPIDDPGMSPLAIWCNEAQERYVLGIRPESLAIFRAFATREQCPYAVIGETHDDPRLQVYDEWSQTFVIDLQLGAVLEPPLNHARTLNRPTQTSLPALKLNISPSEAAKRVLQLPAVASKLFLITIGDRTVGGLIARDPLVGPWQVPVADVGVTSGSFIGFKGEAMAMGERTPLALISPASAARMAVAEAVLNMAAADISKLSNIKLSANWMAACGTAKEDEALYDAVVAVGKEFCPALDLAIPVGKDSLSMQVRWQHEGSSRTVRSPLSLIVSAFAPVNDVRKTLTPVLQTDSGETVLLFIDLAHQHQRLGGSALAQVMNQLGNECPDADAETLKNFFQAFTELKNNNYVLAYHDRSDGGLFVTLCEMAFASRVGLEINLKNILKNDSEEAVLSALFNEELGAVLQIREQDKKAVEKILDHAGLNGAAYWIGKPIHHTNDKTIQFFNDQKLILENALFDWYADWIRTSYHIQKLRDNPECADSEHEALLDQHNPGLFSKTTFDWTENPTTDFATININTAKPKVAILRAPGVNGQFEMAAAFSRAGFECLDVHLHDLAVGAKLLDEVVGLAACGGFSYGDVLGAGRGWANRILGNQKLREQFETFFSRSDTFTLGVCNGCQMLVYLRDLMPGTEDWPYFERNQSEQFEARLLMVELTDSPSVLLKNMSGSQIPIVVSHGEGRANWHDADPILAAKKLITQNQVSLRYIKNSYPFNPNGSPEAIAGICSSDGRVTLMMPHPERSIRTIQNSWRDKTWQGDMGPWFKLFENAKNFVS